MFFVLIASWLYACGMLLRRRFESNVVWYESPILAAAGVPHGFSTRLGGVSLPPFDSLNFGNPAGAVQDPAQNLEANYRRLQSALGVSDRKVLRVHQMHGCAVAVAEADRAFDFNTPADAVVVTQADCMASVRVADCVPVLLAGADGRAVAAVHAGWRGVVAGVVGRAVEQLRKIGREGGFLAAIGPSIGRDAFEVGPEVLGAFVGLFGDQAPVRRAGGGKGRVDLRAAIDIQLRQCGIRPQDIDTTDRCSFTHADEFFSHRRESGVTGRMVALIGVSR
jgi:purine-nucleoside/S-methyl-5'-thioadenosine phosphorylase / adenosine deaminase